LVIVAGVLYITQGTIAVLELLLAAEGLGSTIAVLVERSGESRQTVTRVLGRLVVDGRVDAAATRRAFTRQMYTLRPEAVDWARQKIAERGLSVSARKRRRLNARFAAERAAVGFNSVCRPGFPHRLPQTVSGM
jgi:DNA-binding IclR family transcriptional regulator